MQLIDAMGLVREAEGCHHSHWVDVAVRKLEERRFDLAKLSKMDVSSFREQGAYGVLSKFLRAHVIADKNLQAA